MLSSLLAFRRRLIEWQCTPAREALMGVVGALVGTLPSFLLGQVSLLFVAAFCAGGAAIGFGVASWRKRLHVDR